MKSPTKAQPCKILVHVVGPRGDLRETIVVGSFRSVRAARRNIMRAADCMSDLYSGGYRILLARAGSEVREVRDSTETFVLDFMRRDRADNSIGARLDRGECVAV